MTTSSKHLGVDGIIYDGTPFLAHLATDQTFRILFHPPHEMPSDRALSYSVETKKTVKFLVTPVYKTIDASLVELTSQSRNCYRENESQNLLKFFKTYSKSNCRHEHMSAFVDNACGCVPFGMISGLILKLKLTILNNLKV